MPTARRRYLFLTVADVEIIVDLLAPQFYADYPDPMPDRVYLGGEQGRGQLESALLTPQATWGGRYLYRTVFDKAAAMFRSIVLDHPLVDGNKRTGLTATFVFLLLNGYVFWMPREEAVDLAVKIADRKIDVPGIAARLRRHSLNLDKLLEMEPHDLARDSERVMEIIRPLTILRNRLVHFQG